MSKKFLIVSVFFFIIMLCISGAFWLWNKNEACNDDQGMQVIEMNQTQKMLEKALNDNDISQLPAIIQRVEDQKKAIARIEQSNTETVNIKPIIIAFASCTIFLLTVVLYIYFKILRPFSKMKTYAESIAAGDFDTELNYERSNYFGNFTWAFDSMRREITKARTLEKEAVENNKVVIATLSHDIKTPIASIRAYAEGLEANLDDQEDREYFLQVIMKKCDEVSNLTNDLFIHSIVDLEKLHIETEKSELSSLVDEVINELSAEKGDISYSNSVDEVYSEIDRKRFTQVIENIVNNARKYAKPPITASLSVRNNMILLNIRDYGDGIPDEDMPFVFDKFYRGSNTEDQQGSGLGLFIVKYIMKQFKGDVYLHNHSDGLEVILELPLIS